MKPLTAELPITPSVYCQIKSFIMETSVCAYSSGQYDEAEPF
uniref:Uncharacterized protein n=1 Tax=Anguilla anguilla TaxID=7936 RepID=A0A0E9UDP9_ANGAN